MNYYNNPVVAQLPKHLLKFIVPQYYDRYTSIDQAVWRYVMRQNYAYLRNIAYYPYIPGLTKAGLTIESVPDLQAMNDALKKIGWGAVTVDGFIPPSAFMEFQAYRVLVIAADIRSIDHISYTPAPDIIHESSGHAPIIGEPEYADYLQYFGSVGTRALSSGKDMELYEAIRELSIVKEKENANEAEIKAAESKFEAISKDMGEPSEMALLSRLHWWTVEYGLIGTLADPKIYGAGLLSSIGESANCMRPEVKKLPYTLAAIDYAYDITQPQPQLFVTPDFKQVYAVLDEFANKMAFRVGGKESVAKAIDSRQICTLVYSSGLQVSGQVVAFAETDEFIGIKTSGPTALAFDHKQLEGHGKSYHKDGFSSPVGRLAGLDKPLEDCSLTDLKSLGIEEGALCDLTFESGLHVVGQVQSLTFRGDKLLLISITDCTVRGEDGHYYFLPEWGTYDMAIGERIVSVFAGAADKDAFEGELQENGYNPLKVDYSDRSKQLQQVYQHIREAREKKVDFEFIEAQLELLSPEHSDNWLAALEVFEIALHQGLETLAKRAEDFLIQQLSLHPELTKLIQDGLRLAKDKNISLTLG